MPQLLYFATEDWSFCQHFLPMARAARAAGCDVVVATRVRSHADRLIAAGCRVVPLESERGSFAPVEIFRTMLRMRAILRAERPDIVHCIGIRMVVLGGVSAKWAKAPALLLAPTGLGLLWIVNGVFHRVGRAVIRFVVGRYLRGPRTFYLFENTDDPAEFGLDAACREVTIVGGAGVDPDEFQVAPEPPAPPVKFAVVARMVRTKGIAEAVAAIGLARGQGAPVELHLFGPPDPSNRRAFTEAELQKWSVQPGVHWHGSIEDIAYVWHGQHVAMLLSYREGLPRCLVEAAAVGRPIVASDVTGCHELVRDGVEGILVPLGDVMAAASAVARLAGDAGLRARLGAAARRRFEERFTEDAVRGVVGALYRSILAES
ncbi:MAG TPA: glycosyltransferase [Xanthobacteraceae bacterium]|nr:glycosyltransferase [Xanthobacteraceae bacterium]